MTAMSVTVPHYLLFTESSRHKPGRYVASAHETLDTVAGRWRFVLEAVDGSSRVEAEDHEPHVSGERLELLAVVRGLEAIEQPSRVTLLSSSRYVNRGIRFGLESWRENHWQWESYGQMLPVKNRDLWARVDGALRIHRVACRGWMAKGTWEDEPACPASPMRELVATTGCPPESHEPSAAASSEGAPARRRPRSPSRRPTRRTRPTSVPAERWWHQVVRLFGGELYRPAAVRLGA